MIEISAILLVLLALGVVLVNRIVWPERNKIRKLRSDFLRARLRATVHGDRINRRENGACIYESRIGANKTEFQDHLKQHEKHYREESQLRSDLLWEKEFAQFLREGSDRQTRREEVWNGRK